MKQGGAGADSRAVRISVDSPFPAWAWPLVWEWIQSFRGRVCDDFAPATCAEFVAHMLGYDPAATWAVIRDDELGGLMVTPRLTPVVTSVHTVFKRSFWGRETTVAAGRAVYRRLFDAGAQKLESEAFADNHQVRAFARELGWVQEGLRRRRTLRGGLLVDMVEFGLVVEDFDAVVSRCRLDRERRSGGPVRVGPDEDPDADVHPESARDSGPGGGDDLEVSGGSGPGADEDGRDERRQPQLCGHNEAPPDVV
jgi:RimJ/RimL family protein N-acetyltransferase